MYSYEYNDKRVLLDINEMGLHAVFSYQTVYNFGVHVGHFSNGLAPAKPGAVCSQTHRRRKRRCSENLSQFLSRLILVLAMTLKPGTKSILCEHTWHRN